MSSTAPLDERTRLMLATQAHDHQNKMTNVSRSVTELKAAKGALEEEIGQLSRRLRHRMTTGLSTVVTVGIAGTAGFIDGYTEEKNWKLGPVKFTSAAGLAAVVTGLLLEDADMAEFASAIGRGLSVGQVYMAGRESGTKKGQPGAPAPAPAPGPLAAKK